MKSSIILQNDPRLTVGDVFVLRTQNNLVLRRKSRSYSFLKKSRNLNSGWSFVEMNEDGKAVYSRSSKMND